MNKLIPLILLSLLFISCKNGTSTPEVPKINKAAEFEKILDASTGQDYTLLKANTAKAGYSLYKNNTTGKIIAFNLNKYDFDTMKTYDDYQLVSVETDVVPNLKATTEFYEDGYWDDIYETDYWTEEYYDSDCDCYYTESYSEEVWVGETWVDTSYYYTWYDGGGFRFSNTNDFFKDFETMAALGEEKSLKLLSQKFKLSLNLSEDRSQQLGKLYFRWQKLESKRELTEEEKSIFATDALGVSYKEAEKAIASKMLGDDSSYNALLETAADVNRTTPEQIGKFLEQLTFE